MSANAKKPMLPDTVRALRQSIEKWEGIEAGTRTDQGPVNCGLCKLYHNVADLYCTRILPNGEAERCPVYAATVELFCNGTPYRKWVMILDENPIDKTADTPALKKIAHSEVLFLRSLLPKGGKK